VADIPFFFRAILIATQISLTLAHGTPTIAEVPR
jgi:hypothetical protein